MKTLALLILLILTAASAQGKTKSFTDLSKWKLVWSDEFNYKGFPDKNKWSFEEGFLRNEELQYYTNGRKENVRVGGGVLTIEARKERTKNPRYDASSTYWQTSREYGEYTSGDITTQGKHSWTYGRIEVRAKLPRGNGVWPAIWTLGSNIPTASWPGCGEIDIMENLGKEPNRIYVTSHYAVDGKHQSNGNNFECPKPYADFHIYAIEWFPDRIDFYLDSTKYHTFAIDAAGKGDDNPFRKPHFILLNLALGGWGGPVDDTILPQKYLIDYVRVYEQKAIDNR
jgi:beta-glucanase (GH16 family)